MQYKVGILLTLFSVVGFLIGIPEVAAVLQISRHTDLDMGMTLPAGITRFTSAINCIANPVFGKNRPEKQVQYGLHLMLGTWLLIKR